MNLKFSIAALLLLAVHWLCFTDEQPFLLEGKLVNTIQLNIKNDTSIFRDLYSTNEIINIIDIALNLKFVNSMRSYAMLNMGFQFIPNLTDLSTAEDVSPDYCLKELFVDIGLSDWLYLRIGKQILKWGIGWIDNPFDVMTQANYFMLDPEKKKGLYSINFELLTPDILTSFYGVLSDKLEKLGAGGKISKEFSPYASLELGAFYSETTQWIADLGIKVNPLYDLKYLDSFSIWIEGMIYSKCYYPVYLYTPNDPTNYYSDLLVKEYTDTFNYRIISGSLFIIPVTNTTLFLEYYHIGEGIEKNDFNQIIRDLKSSNPIISAGSSVWLPELYMRFSKNGKNYLYVSINQEHLTENTSLVFDYVGLSSFFLMNLDDFSTFVSHSMTLFVNENVNIAISFKWITGDIYNEFSNSPLRYIAAVDVEYFF
ncbi:MAG: hypothetical protein JXJ04_25555 [Spirochaetales bacterium]|nr:hypothetical protein [Spirochaetales bacterium]